MYNIYVYVISVEINLMITFNLNKYYFNNIYIYIYRIKNSIVADSVILTFIYNDLNISIIINYI